MRAILQAKDDYIQQVRNAICREKGRGLRERDGMRGRRGLG